MASCDEEAAGCGRCAAFAWQRAIRSLRLVDKKLCIGYCAPFTQDPSVPLMGSMRCAAPNMRRNGFVDCHPPA